LPSDKDNEKQVDGRVARAQKQRESRKAAVLQAARRVFAQKGYHATSIDDLIEAAGIARGTFYLYFESKRSIFDQLLDGLLQTLRGTVRRIEVGPGAAAPIEQVTANVDRVLDTLLSHREIARILLREAVGIDVEFDRKLGDFYQNIESMIERAIHTGQEMKLVRDCDPQVVARCILGAMKEVIHWAFVLSVPGSTISPTGTEGEATAPVDVRRLGRDVVGFALQGLFV
jgi:AcrR family transcriptional regulator